MTRDRQTAKIIKRHAWKLSLAPLLFFILIPIFSLTITISPSDFWEQIQQETVRQAIGMSLQTATCAMLLTVLLGTPAAYYLSRSQSPIHRLIDTILDLPTILPPAVAGVALLMAFGRKGLIGSLLLPLGISFPFTTPAVIMAQLFVASPFYIKAATMGFSKVECEMKKAAALDGANRWQIFRYIMVPMSWSSIVSGCVMTWARALGEFGATILFAGNFPGRTQTMPLAIYMGFESNMSTAVTLSIILVFTSFVILFLVKRILRPAYELERDDTDY